MATPFADHLARVEKAYENGEINDRQYKQLVDEADKKAKPYEDLIRASAEEQLQEAEAFEASLTERYDGIESRLKEISMAIAGEDDLGRLRELRDELHRLHREELNLERLASQHESVRATAEKIKELPIAFVDTLYDRYPSLLKSFDGFGMRIDPMATGPGFRDPGGPTGFTKSTPDHAPRVRGRR
ncbi:hypothetical protein DLJ47_01895 [Micromonospora sp. S4605]|uniref:hypothetical protein n=1 Tax=Micromonospora sp. S4605 TaxID=1420897 RepID=UPI000D6F75D8|nr:hypothetical protein [Micromonospora sp. S4605]PWU57685.1 hypothetical protein DLJ47_01895 [Micromonospora sp. S4605]